MTDPDGRQKREVYYHGMVQGVGFRYTARQIAEQFDVTGYVQNMPDGRVLLLAEGLSEELDRFLAAIEARMGHYIDGSRQAVGPASGHFHRFEVRF